MSTRTFEPESAGETTASLPTGLTSPRAKLVYLFVAVRGGATVEELADGLDMGKLALLSVLRTLRERDLLGVESGRYVLG